MLEDGGEDRPPLSILPKLNKLSATFPFLYLQPLVPEYSLHISFPSRFAIIMGKFQMGKVEHQLKVLWVVAAGKEAEEICLMAWGAVSDQFESVGGKVEA